MASPGLWESIARDLGGPGVFGGKFQLRRARVGVVSEIADLTPENLRKRASQSSSRSWPRREREALTPEIA
jgi:hypothetical protein